MATDVQALASTAEATTEENGGGSALKVIGWFSVGIAVATIGLIVGAELRNRYRFNRRTPYDFYSNADTGQASEYGVGI